jgi:CSLREA domain-containing protein
MYKPKLLHIAMVGGLAVAVACSEDPTSIEDAAAPSPNLDVVANEWYPFSWYWWACEEPVLIEGKQHNVWSMQQNGNRWQSHSHFNMAGTGVGDYTGRKYQFSETYNYTENAAAGWTYPFNWTYTERLKLVGQGGTPNLHGRWQFHVTVNANGDVTAEVDRWEFDCDGGGPKQYEGTLVVNTTDDDDDGACDPKHCSLREALVRSNSLAGEDIIAFRIPGRGPHTIQPDYELPWVWDPVIIDGTTQPGFKGNPIIELDGSNAGEVDGLTIFAGNTTVRGLVINRFGSGVLVNGINLMDNGGNVIEGNYIGTDVTGTEALGNSNAGVNIGSSDNLIGGTTPAARNVISGNLEGVTIADPDATGNMIQGNYIGTDASGTVALGNRAGILLLAPGNVIGGDRDDARNVISGNDNGVNLGNSDATGNQVLGNYIGPDVSGTQAIGNTEHGVAVWDGASDNTIGGRAPGAGNIISANGIHGISIVGSETRDNVVRGNFIGTDRTGTQVLGNGERGVHIEEGASGNVIGGRRSGSPNVISGNRGGVRITGDASWNRVYGNYIGTDVSGTLDLGNMLGGVIILGGAWNNRVGGTLPGLGNRIGFSGRAGIRFLPNAGPGNAILGNSIFASGNPDNSLGIDLGGGGVTPNDPGDGDNVQNFPVLWSATGSSVTGMLHSKPDAEFRLEFFANSDCDLSGHGEGETYLGDGTVDTDGSGDGVFDVTLSEALTPGMFVTATATDPDNNTSEFSECVDST